jgi:hypothetical protein
MPPGNFTETTKESNNERHSRCTTHHRNNKEKGNPTTGTTKPIPATNPDNRHRQHRIYTLNYQEGSIGDPRNLPKSHRGKNAKSDCHGTTPGKSAKQSNKNPASSENRHRRNGTKQKRHWGGQWTQSSKNPGTPENFLPANNKETATKLSLAIQPSTATSGILLGTTFQNRSKAPKLPTIFSMARQGIAGLSIENRPGNDTGYSTTLFHGDPAFHGHKPYTIRYRDSKSSKAPKSTSKYFHGSKGGPNPPAPFSMIPSPPEPPSANLAGFGYTRLSPNKNSTANSRRLGFCPWWSYGGLDLSLKNHRNLIVFFQVSEEILKVF